MRKLDPRQDEDLKDLDLIANEIRKRCIEVSYKYKFTSRVMFINC